MIRRFVLLIALVACMLVPGQGAADAAAGRLSIPKIGVKAKIVKVPVKHGRLMIGHALRGVVYTPKNGDPPCDPMGSTLYAGHAWRAGNGVADKWGSLKKGDLITVAGCKFRVTKKEYWSDKRSIRPLSRPDGPPRVVLYGCKADDYSKATVVFARKVNK